MCCLLSFLFFFFFNDTATTEIYTLSLHDALPISVRRAHLGIGGERVGSRRGGDGGAVAGEAALPGRRRRCRGCPGRGCAAPHRPQHWGRGGPRAPRVQRLELGTERRAASAQRRWPSYTSRRPAPL